MTERVYDPKPFGTLGACFDQSLLTPCVRPRPLVSTAFAALTDELDLTAYSALLANPALSLPNVAMLPSERSSITYAGAGSASPPHGLPEAPLRHVSDLFLGMSRLEEGPGEGAGARTHSGKGCEIGVVCGEVAHRGKMPPRSKGRALRRLQVFADGDGGREPTFVRRSGSGRRAMSWREESPGCCSDQDSTEDEAFPSQGVRGMRAFRGGCG